MVITATYPIITVLIAAFLLGEPVSFRALLGTALAMLEFSSFDVIAMRRWHGRSLLRDYGSRS